MSRGYRDFSPFALVALALLTGCGHQVQNAEVGPAIQLSAAGLPAETVDPSHTIASLDFGISNGKQPWTLLLKNIGTVDLTLVSAEQTPPDAEFSVDLVPNQVLVAGGPTIGVPVHFVPFTTGQKTLTLLLRTDSATLPSFEVRISAREVKLSVALNPQQIDFGNVVVNTTATRSLAVTNNSGIDLVGISLGALKGTDPLLFTTVPAAGTPITLKDGATLSVTVQYTPLVALPTQSQAYFSIILCSSGTGCQPLVSLRGTAVSTWLSISPSSLDFSCVPAGRGVTRFLTLSNVANATIELTADPAVLNLDSSGSLVPAGAFQPGPGFPAKGAWIPANQSIQIPVVFTPPTTGNFSGELDIWTNDATNANLKIPLTGCGS